MNTRLGTLLFVAIVMAAGLVACGAPAAPAYEAEMPAPAPPLEVAPAPPAAEAPAARPAAGGAVLYRTGPEQAPRDERAQRLIIKNAEVKLLVADTDAAIDGVTQVIVDVGGYLISSRIWYQEWGGENLKYATLTFGVPAEEFERSLRRLRQLAVRVIDETSTGQDVTEEYVDLLSRLESLQATRARILEFLARARTVEEALTVNDQLAGVEVQIEEVQGRINYYADRAAFSTITVHLEPVLPELVPTPTPTPTATPTPTPWDPGATFSSARRTVTSAYQGMIDLAIWMLVVVVPVLGPPVLVIWLIWRVMRRKQPPSPPGADAGG